MLIQITNHCTLGCPHCMQCSGVNNQHMNEDVFRKSLEFGAWSGAFQYNISGGEPTEHPMFKKYIAILNKHLIDNTIVSNLPGFTIESNGEWVRSGEKVKEIKDICRMKRLMAIQVSSFPGLYKNFDFIKKYKSKIEALSNKVCVVNERIISMQDIGRAHTTDKLTIKTAIENNPYHMSCLNGCLLSKQTSDIKQLTNEFFLKNISCKPLIDWQGNVHWSESCQCPSYGNVLTDSFEEIWNKLKKAVPCGKCKGYERFMNSSNPQLILAQKIIFNK